MCDAIRCASVQEFFHGIEFKELWVENAEEEYEREEVVEAEVA